jgi:hypothetical protein
VNTDLKQLFAPLIALAILTVIGLQTSDALQHAGAWRAARRPARTAAPDPYARLEAQIAAPAGNLVLSSLRDPFSYGRAPVVTSSAPARPRVPPPPPQPVLTAILQSDNDPRALVHYADRDYTVQTGSLFADFKVISITAEQVVLDRGGQRLILHRPTKKGD